MNEIWILANAALEIVSGQIYGLCSSLAVDKKNQAVFFTRQSVDHRLIVLLNI